MNLENMKKLLSKNLVIVSLLHLLVDLISAGSIIMAYTADRIDFEYFEYIFLVYNCTAFLLQPFFGFLVDKIKQEKLRSTLKALTILSIGILTLGFTSLVFSIEFSSFLTPVFISTILLGSSNALFHVIGGKESLLVSTKATPGGIFVSTGAIGIGIASMMGNIPLTTFYQIFIILGAVTLAIVLSFLYLFSKEEPEPLFYETYENKNISFLIIIVVLLCVAIAVRSFLGFYAKMSDDLSSWEALLLLSIAAFVGKAIGGIILDLAGPYFIIIISTILSTVLSFFLSISYLDYIFVISFNMLMPLTLDALRKIFPNKEGFAFGLAAGFLIPGFLLGSILKHSVSHVIVVPLICFLTGLSLLIVYILKGKIKNDTRNNWINWMCSSYYDHWISSTFSTKSKR